MMYKTLTGWIFGRTVLWMCLAAMLLVAISSGAAQVMPSARGQRQRTVSSAGPQVPLEDAGKKLSRKYDLNRVGNRGIGGGFDLYSIEKEQQLGEQLGSALARAVRQADDSETVNYVTQLCQKVSRQSDNRFPLTVKIIQSEEANIFSLPGGFLYVTTGVFGIIDNEAELAGLISHEIAHIAARHVTKQAARQTLWKIMSTPAMLLPFAGLAIQMGDIAIPMKLLRNAELEADLLGLQYMYLAGYDPNEFVRFLDGAYVPEARPSSRVAQLLSEYPSLEERLRRDLLVISTFPPRDEYLLDTNVFAEVKAKNGPSQAALRHGSKGASGPRLRRRTN